MPSKCVACGFWSVSRDHIPSLGRVVMARSGKSSLFDKRVARRELQRAPSPARGAERKCAHVRTCHTPHEDSQHTFLSLRGNPISELFSAIAAVGGWRLAECPKRAALRKGMIFLWAVLCVCVREARAIAEEDRVSEFHRRDQPASVHSIRHESRWPSSS